jgi:transcriptional regulator of acetoin/glycerol metabolism
MTFDQEAARAIVGYSWPLNVRELRRCLSRARILAGDGVVGLRHLPAEVRCAGADLQEDCALESGVDRQRRDLVLQALRENGGNISATARSLNRVRAQVQRWIQRYKIEPEEYLELECSRVARRGS